MVGRNKRQTATVKVKPREDEEIEMYDDVPTRQKRRGKTRKPPVEAELEHKVDEDNDDLLDGFDLEGVPEEEKQQLKKAILESKQDESFNIPEACVDIVKIDETSAGRNISSGIESNESDNWENSDEDCLAEDTVSSDEVTLAKIVDTATMNAINGDDDDDDDETQPPEDQDEVLDLDLSKSTMDPDICDISPCPTQHEDDDDIAQATTSQLKEIQEVCQDSDGFEVMDSLNAESPRPPKSSQESQSGLEKSQGSRRLERSQKEVTQGSSGKSCNTPGQSLKHDGICKHNKLEETDVPLQRHYRAVKKKFVYQNDYFPVRGMDTVQCAKAIIQLFEIYSTKLKEAQRKCSEREEWGVSVKSGQHQSRTIDIKRRGRESPFINLDMSDEEDDFQQSTDRKKIKKKNEHLNNLDDDFLPELTVEKTRIGADRRRAGAERNKETEEIMSADTQEYDIEENADDFNMNATRSRMKDNKLRRDVVQSTRNSRQTRGVKVLVEDTQQADLDYKEALRSSREDIIVEETQPPDDEDDLTWLSVDQRKGQFENQMQKVKLKGYAIPKRKSEILEYDKQNSTSENIAAEKDPTNTNDINLKDFNNEKKCAKNDQIIVKKKGRKRRGEKEKPKILVEDTQDIDTETRINECKNTQGVRLKRKCFMLESDSDVESVPETQNVNMSQENCVHEHGINEEEEKENEEPESVKTSKSPGKTDDEIMNDNVDEESQSPIIKRSRRLYRTPMQKFNEPVTDEDFEDNVKNDAKRRKVLQDNKEIETDQKGVKRLFSRPASKESNASDDKSVSSSQVSSIMLDDRGDLFSTQFPTKKKLKSSLPNNVNNQTDLSEEEIIDKILNLNDSDDDELIVKEVTIDYGAKKTKILTKQPLSTKKNQKNNNTGDISQYFDKKYVPGTKSKSVQIDLENDFNHSKHLLSTSSVTEHFAFNNFEENTVTKTRNKEDPIMCLSSEDEHEDPIVSPEKKQMNQNLKTVESAIDKSIATRIPLISIPSDTDTKRDIEQVKEDMNHVTYVNHSLYPITARRPLRSSPRSRAASPITGGFNVQLNHENPPILLHDIMNQPHMNVANSQGGARPKLTRRTRKVSETITIADLDGDHSQNKYDLTQHIVRGHEGVPVRNEGPTRPTKRRVGRVHIMEDDQDEPINKLKKKSMVTAVEMISCPLCSEDFPITIIEEHAANCLGPVSADLEEPISYVHPHHHDNSRKQLDDPDHIEAVLGSINHLHHLDEEDPELAEIVNIPVEHVSSVVKDISCSPGEEGEVVQCYICDANVPKGTIFESHLKQCLVQATRQQLEVDTKGSKTFYNHDQEEDEVPVLRNTRGRNRNHRDLTGNHDNTRGRNCNHGDVASNHDNTIQRRLSGARFMEKEDGYTSEPSQTSKIDQSYSSTDGSSWDEDSESDSDDNVTLAAVARSGSSALVTGPWNQSKPNKKIKVSQSEDEVDGIPVPDWLRNRSHSPIRSFVPISQQEDSEYFKRQFSYKEKAVQNRMNKRKKSQGKPRRRKRRKIKRKKKT